MSLSATLTRIECLIQESPDLGLNSDNGDAILRELESGLYILEGYSNSSSKCQCLLVEIKHCQYFTCRHWVL